MKILGHDIKDLPPNNHGIKPQIFIEEEIEIHKGNYLALVPTFSTECSIAFHFRVTKEPAEEKKGKPHNIVILTNNPFFDVIVDSAFPVIASFIPSSQNAQFNSFDNEYITPVNYNQTYNIEFRQRYISDGMYQLSIIMDGMAKMTSTAKNQPLLHNLSIQACGYTDNTGDAVGAYVGNFKFTNFL